MKNFFMFAGIQAVMYTILVFNLRVIGHGETALAVASDVLYAFFQFTILEKISKEEKSRSRKLGYVFGSAIGTVIGMQLR